MRCASAAAMCCSARARPPTSGGCCWRVEWRRRTRWIETVAGVMDRPGVWAGGFQAWSDQAGYLATARGASSGVMLRVPAKALGELARAWFPFGVHLIEGFFRTVRTMEA